MGLSSNWSIRSCGIYLSGLSWKTWRYQSVKWDWNLICLDNFIPSPEIIHLFSSDNSFVCVMVVSWQLLSQSLIPLASVYSRGTRYPPHNLLWPHHRGPMSQELKRQTCCMRSQPHERLWPPLIKLNLEMVGKPVSAAVAVAKKVNFRFSIPILKFQFQYQIRGIRVTKDWYFRQMFQHYLEQHPHDFSFIVDQVWIYNLWFTTKFLGQIWWKKDLWVMFSNAKSMTCNLEMKSITAMQNPFDW